MTPFKKLREAFDWVRKNARGECCVLHANARLQMSPWCDGDMRLLQAFHNGEWS